MRQPFLFQLFKDFAVFPITLFMLTWQCYIFLYKITSFKMAFGGGFLAPQLNNTLIFTVDTGRFFTIEAICSQYVLSPADLHTTFIVGLKEAKDSCSPKSGSRKKKTAASLGSYSSSFISPSLWESVSFLLYRPVFTDSTFMWQNPPCLHLLHLRDQSAQVAVSIFSSIPKSRRKNRLGPVVSPILSGPVNTMEVKIPFKCLKSNTAVEGAPRNLILSVCEILREGAGMG